ncbi:MAG: hypothetical protein HY238_24960, partial [Acidobacteria bacterium]|nr:hypothetical protein [Acidobacteriota bacterium]
THSKAYRWIMGSLHGLAHVAAAFFLTWGANYLCVTVLGWQWESIRQLALCGALIFAGGWIAGPIIMGIYLLVSLNVFRRHTNEAFSSLAIPDYKNFLRLRIDAGGNLTIFPVGLRRVPRRWKEATGGVSQLEPDDPQATPPRLIEAPVVIKKK